MLKLPSPIVQPEEYKKSLSTIVSRFSVPIVVVGSVFAFWILSQLLATILLGSAALVAAVASIAFGWFSVAMIKPFSLWVANKRTSMMLAQARKNPIETRIFVSNYCREQLRLRAEELDSWLAEVNQFGAEVRKMELTDPPEEVEPFKIRYQDLLEDVAVEQNLLAEARLAADAYDKATEKSKRFWKLGAMSDRMNKFSQESQEDRDLKLLAMEAFETTETAMSKVFARIENKARTRKHVSPKSNQPQLDVSKSTTVSDIIDISPKVKEMR